MSVNVTYDMSYTDQSQGSENLWQVGHAKLFNFLPKLHISKTIYKIQIQKQSVWNYFACLLKQVFFLL